MRNIILIISSLIFFVNCLADTFDRRVRTHLTQDGEVYYIGSKRLNKTNQGVKCFEYDLTYVEGQDSATVNFTIISNNPSDVSTFTLGNGNLAVQSSSISLLYHDMIRKDYEVRTTSKVSYSDLKQLLSDEAPVYFYISRNDGQKQQAHYTQKQWEKEKKLFRKVFYTITK